MKLHKVFQNDESCIYGIVIDGKPFFFYEGFTSEEEAKSTLKEYYLLKDSPNKPKCVAEAIINMMLKGTWSAIE